MASIGNKAHLENLGSNADSFANSRNHSGVTEPGLYSHIVDLLIQIIGNIKPNLSAKVAGIPIMQTIMRQRSSPSVALIFCSAVSMSKRERNGVVLQEKK